MRTAGLVSRGVALLGLTAATCFAQTGPGGSWAFSIGSYVGALNIVAIGTDADHPAGGNSGWVMFDRNFTLTIDSATYTCQWGGAMLMPFYNLQPTTGLPSYSADLNPAGKATFNQLLTYAAMGKAVARVDFYLLKYSPIGSGSERPCVLKLVQTAP